MIEFTPSGRSTGNAYVGFEDTENNQLAVSKFDGKKAVGQVITVEEIKPLNVIAQAPRGPRNNTRGSSGPRGFRGSSKGGPARGGRESRPKKPTLEDLDAELNRYMSGEPEPEPEVQPEVSEPQSKFRQSSRSRSRPSKPTVEELDKSLDDYMSARPFAATGGEGQ